MAGLRIIEAILDINTKSWDIPKIEAIQGDIGSLTLRITLEASGTVVPIVGWRANFVAFPDRIHIVSDPVVNFTNPSKGEFEYTFVKEAFSVPGIIDNARFVFIKEDGTQLTGMPRFTYEVEEDPSQGKIEMDDFIGDFTLLQAQITAIELKNNALENQINSLNIVKVSETTNWQKGVKITADNGYSKAVPVGVADWNAFTETGFYSVYATQLMANKPPTLGLYLDVEIHRRSGDTAYQRVTDITNNRTYYRSQMVGVWSAWAEGETIIGAQSKADLAQANAIKYVTDKFADTGWKDLPLKSGFVADGSTPQYRKIGSKVIYRGGVGRTTGAKGVFATAPVGFRTSDPYLEGFNQGQRTSADGASSLVYAKLNGDMEIVSATNTSTIWLSGIYYYVD
ncbi:BppU family phage baseplate upper protein [Listeria booriae]|uniref:BppU family phage baseplate upper protein n=1 Tax=Listeria booriae TaxID=1552123 RepID=A0A7X0YJL8_9LIST|nr:BppU family phage baseplate upper protein [Listeria booriae]MBC1290638.1 BppU family phage baseplate upper protein [Listeria booriae]MBC2115677.1 BppU family phage baseplate upper protein [Listeria booriae]